MVLIQTIESPIGPLTAAERAGRVCLLYFGTDGPDVDGLLERWYPGEAKEREMLPAVATVLERYFAGEIGALDTVPVELNGTPFQKTVWQALVGAVLPVAPHWAVQEVRPTILGIFLEQCVSLSMQGLWDPSMAKVV